MASEYAQILAAGTASAPLSYTVPNAQELVPLAINANVDGTGAAGAFLAVVEIVSDGGVVIARAPTTVTIAAGASAEVSWFPLRRALTSSSPVSAYNGLIAGTAGIRSYWTLDETTGSTFHDSGPSALDLTASGAPTIGAAPLITSGHAATFSGAVDGLGHSIQYATRVGGYGTWGGDGSVTVEAWIKTSAAPAAVQSIVGMDDNQFRLFQFRVSTTFKIEFITFDVGDVAAFTCTGATVLNNGATHYVAGVHDGTANTLTVYVDGVSDGNALSTSSWKGTTPSPVIASRLQGAFQVTPFAGTVDEVAIYNRALSAAEIADHYTAGTT